MAINRDYKKSSSHSKANNPLITGIVIGVLIGLAIALAVALYINTAPSPFKQPQTPPDTSAPAAPAGGGKPGAQQGSKGDDKGDDKGSRFTYYNILPGTEQPVTEQEIKQAPPDAKAQYFLQAGSFQSEADANNLKAKLALLGIETTIQTANVPEKGVYHRVRVGPFNDIEEMNKARTTLSQNGIQPSLIKVQDAASAAKP